MTIHVAPHTRKRPLAALRAAKHLELARDLKAEREARFQAEMKKMAKALEREVARRVRWEMK